MLAALATFIPVTAIADVSTSKGSTYRLDACFLAPDHLALGFEYPDHMSEFTMRDGRLQVAVTGKAESTGGEAEKNVAFGHQFHAIAFNAAQWGKGDKLTLPYGGRATIIERSHNMPSKMRLDLPGTTPIELQFSDWKGDTPFRVHLVHEGVTYDYRYRVVERACDLY